MARAFSGVKICGPAPGEFSTLSPHVGKSAGTMPSSFMLRTT
jgi:hypothetical protein